MALLELVSLHICKHPFTGTHNVRYERGIGDPLPTLWGYGVYLIK